METQVLTVQEAGERLGLGRVSAYRAVRRGEIPALRFGKRLVVPKAALQRMLREAGRAEPRAARRHAHQSCGGEDGHAHRRPEGTRGSHTEPA